jgi:hypothetical protein
MIQTTICREFLLLKGNFSRGNWWERFGRGVLGGGTPLGYDEFTKEMRCLSRAVIAFARMGLLLLLQIQGTFC